MHYALIFSTQLGLPISKLHYHYDRQLCMYISQQCLIMFQMHANGIIVDELRMIVNLCYIDN